MALSCCVGVRDQMCRDLLDVRSLYMVYHGMDLMLLDKRVLKVLAGSCYRLPTTGEHTCPALVLRLYIVLRCLRTAFM